MRIITQFEVTISGEEVHTLYHICMMAQELMNRHPADPYAQDVDRQTVQRMITEIIQLEAKD
ncbi:MAG: hypothetical protein ABIJ00_11925 [Candidatus Eisenbacteria bacterium]